MFMGGRCLLCICLLRCWRVPWCFLFVVRSEGCRGRILVDFRQSHSLLETMHAGRFSTHQPYLLSSCSMHVTLMISAICIVIFVCLSHSGLALIETERWPRSMSAAQCRFLQPAIFPYSFGRLKRSNTRESQCSRTSRDVVILSCLPDGVCRMQAAPGPAF